MSIIHNLVTKLPAACGVPNDPVTFTWVDKDGVAHTEIKGLADIFGEHNARLFGFELSNQGGPLNADNFHDVSERIGLGVWPWEPLADRFAAGYAHQLLMFVAKTTKAKGGDWEGKGRAKATLSALETNPSITPVAALLSVEQASTLGNWA